VVPDAYTILLVDDDPDFLAMQKHLFEAQGYDVRCATDPNAAMRQMNEAPPDLIVTDLMMRSLDAGFTLAGHVKGDPRLGHIPVVIVTAVSSRRGFDFQPRGPEDLASMHADAFFEKPVPPRELLARVADLLCASDQAEES